MTNPGSTQELVGLKLLYCNFRSLNQHRYELEKLIADYDIVIGVETWLKVGSSISFPGFTIHRVDRVYANGGQLIFIISNNIDF